MEGRKCPECGKFWYSINSGYWTCEKCGAVIPPQKAIELEKAIKYFEDAIKESDEIIDECSEELKTELKEQKEHFLTALKAMKDMLRYGY